MADINLDRALLQSAEFFHHRQTRAGVVARRLLGTTTMRDAELTDQLISERRRRTRMDGGIGGWVFATTWSAWELLQLGCPADHTAVMRMVGYLLSRQGQPGRFGAGCSERRHAVGHCEHFLDGFFSPGPPDTPIAPLVFPGGTVVTGEWSARFAASCFTLRTVLQARQEHRLGVRRHLESLVVLDDRWQRGEFEPSLSLAFFALGAMALAPLPFRTRGEELSRRLIARQEADGTWPGVQLMLALDTLLALPGPEPREAVTRAVPTLLTRLRSDGSFDETGDEEIALIGLRALRATGAGRATPRPPRMTSSPDRTRSRPRRRPR